MGDFILAHGESYQQCPYNLAHVITNARLIVHLDKCRRAYLKTMKESGKKAIMRQCKFNFVHHVPEPEIDFHESRCPDQYHVIETLRYHESDEFKDTLVEEQKRKIESDTIAASHRQGQSHDDSSSQKDKKHSRKHKSKDVKPQIEESPWGEDTEDWEAGSNGYEAGYDPSDKLKSEIVLFHPRGLSKSERKTFRQEQKMRAADLAMPPKPDVVDVKPLLKLDAREPSKVGPSTSKSKSKAPPPPVLSLKPEPIGLSREDGECSEEEFFGEDPYST